MLEEITIDKLVHGGQGLGTLADGKKVFVWNALPGEVVKARLFRFKRSYAEAIAEEIVKASPDRVEVRKANHLATSPWQILRFDAENRYKKEITRELFTQAGVELPDFEVTSVGDDWHYRNKMEYSFWGDDGGLHLALHKRGSHGKEIVTGSLLALPAIDAAANEIIAELNKLKSVRAGDLKTVIVRATQAGEAVAALFVKPGTFPRIPLPQNLQGLRVYHSNPKSPASVATKLIYELGDSRLTDELAGQQFTYDVNSFFQVNVPIFETVLERIRSYISHDKIVDMYAGVGSIGLSLDAKELDLVEIDPFACEMAQNNAKASKKKVTIIEASTERALDYIRSDAQVIFDPPRSGLHQKVVNRLLESKPDNIVYLSCNPATQARDIALLKDVYAIKHLEVFNFFPHTPHIESLAILQKSV